MAATTVRPVVLGTRGSALALVQARMVARELRERHSGLDVQIREIETQGDRIRDRPVAQFGDKGVFIRSLERALLDGDIDLAVHSLKDVPADVETAGLELVAYSVRADPRDVLVTRSSLDLTSLPPAARIGTGSLRRRVQLLDRRPDLRIEGVRGNVDTRLRRLDEGSFDAICLAAAGLERLGLLNRVSQFLPPGEFVPDAGQGIVVVQALTGSRAAKLAAHIDNRHAHLAATAERAVVTALGAGCGSPVGALAIVDGDELRLRAMAAAEDGGRLTRLERRGSVSDAAALGEDAGRELLAALLP